MPDRWGKDRYRVSSCGLATGHHDLDCREVATKVGRDLPAFRHEQIEPFARFLVAGAAGYLANLLVFALLVEVGVFYLVAAVASFVCAWLLSFLLHRHWTFPGRQPGSLRVEGPAYLAVALGSLAANLGVLSGLVGLGLDPIPAQAVSMIIIAPISYVFTQISLGVRRVGRPTAQTERGER